MNPWAEIRRRDEKSVHDVMLSLCRTRKRDGGIPAATHDSTSGCWTTAATVHAALECGVAQEDPDLVRPMISFLLKKSILAPRKSGRGWPLISTRPISTMATGHVVRALKDSLELFSADDPVRREIAPAVEEGRRWLAHNQLASGGWCAGPKGDGQSAGLIIATRYALDAFKGESAEDSETVRDAVNFLVRQQDYLPKERCTGGWKNEALTGEQQAPVSVADTARSIVALIGSGSLAAGSPRIKKGLEYIKKSADGEALWHTVKRSLSLPGVSVPGEVVINDNTVCDVLHAYSLAGYRRKEYVLAAKFLLESVSKVSGLWHLSDPSSAQPITTWSSADWVIAVSSCLNHDSLSPTQRLWLLIILRVIRRAFTFLLLGVVIYSGAIALARSGVIGGLSADSDTSVGNVLLLGASGSLAGSIILESARWLFRRAISSLRQWRARR